MILADVCINFITDSYSDPGETITNRQIAYRYITSYFIFDALAFLPGLVTLERFGGFTTIYKLKLFRYMKAKRLVNQLDDLIKASGKIFKEHTSYNIRFVVTFVFQFTLLFHIMACVWIIIGTCDSPDTLLSCYEGQSGWI